MPESIFKQVSLDILRLHQTSHPLFNRHQVLRRMWSTWRSIHYFRWPILCLAPLYGQISPIWNRHPADWRWRRQYTLELGCRYTRSQTKDSLYNRVVSALQRKCSARKQVYPVGKRPIAWADAAARPSDDKQQRFLAFTTWPDESTLSGNTSNRRICPVTVFGSGLCSFCAP